MTTLLHPFLFTLLSGTHYNVLAGPLPAPASGVVIRFFNIAQLSADTVAELEQEASRLFTNAGIGITWQQGDPDADEVWSVDFSATPCSEFLRSTVLLLRVIPQAPPGLRAVALGTALPCAKYGPQATVFRDRIEKIALSIPVSMGRVLGHVVAHEIGHVLMRSADHARVGVMRDTWGDQEWKAVSDRELAFTHAEADRMSRAIRITGGRSGQKSQ